MKLNKATATLVKKTMITDTVIETIFESSNDVTFTPGQYLSLNIDERQKRMYSILSAEGNRFTLIIDTKPNGDASKLFATVKPGFETNIIYPMGDFILQDNSSPKIFIATGTGVVPLIAMAKQEMSKNPIHKPVLLWGIRYEKNNYINRYLESEIANGLMVNLCITRPSGSYNGYTGRVTSAIKDLTFELPLSKYEIYICGNKEAVKDVNEVVKALGVANIFMERY